MDRMTTRERIACMFRHEEADRVPIIDEPWAGTLVRWHSEGMPQGMDWRDFFGIDKVETFMPDISPRFEKRVLEETERYVIETSEWGVTLKHFKELDSTPEFLDFRIRDLKTWIEAKARMEIGLDRLDPAATRQDFERWSADGRWIQAGFWFGFDITHSWMMDTETVLVAMMEEPDWIADIFATCLERNFTYYGRAWDLGCRFDSIFWWDDMGYKNAPFFSPATYREVLQPFHRKAVEWAHDRGVKAHLHSCGFIQPLLEEIVATGVDALNPIERKAGMDVLRLKAEYGDRLVLHGGIDTVLWNDRDAVVAEVERIVPTLKRGGGYIFSSDHSIPNSVPLDTYRAIVETVRRVGRYGST